MRGSCLNRGHRAECTLCGNHSQTLRSTRNTSRHTGSPTSQAGRTDTGPARMDKPNLYQPQAPQQMTTEHPSYTSGIIRKGTAHPLGKISGDGKGSTLTGEPSLPGLRDQYHSPHTRDCLPEEQGVGTDWTFLPQYAPQPFTLLE